MPLGRQLLACYAAIFGLKEGNVNETVWNDFVHKHMTGGHPIATVYLFYWHFGFVRGWFDERDFFHGDLYRKTECELRLCSLYIAIRDSGPAEVREKIEVIMERYNNPTVLQQFSDAMLQEILDYLKAYRPSHPFQELSSFYNTLPMPVRDEPIDDDENTENTDKENRRPSVTISPDRNANLQSLLHQLHMIGEM